MADFLDNLTSILDEPVVRPNRFGKLAAMAKGAASRVSSSGILDTMYGPKSTKKGILGKLGGRKPFIAMDALQLYGAVSDVSKGNYKDAAANVGYLGAWHGANALARRWGAATGAKLIAGRLAGAAAGIPGLVLTIGAPIAYEMYKESSDPQPRRQPGDLRRAFLATKQETPNLQLLEDTQEYDDSVPEEDDSEYGFS